MTVHRIKKGLDLPITGAPQQVIEAGSPVRHVALLGADYVGMKPKMEVKVGDAVKRGQLLFEDRKTPGVRFTAPGAGSVVAVHRGEKRAFLSLVIALNERELAGQAGPEDRVTFASYTRKPVEQLGVDEIKALLVESGLWTALRQRPFSRVPSPESTPRALFVTAIDTSPLTADVGAVLKGREADFQRGLAVLSKLAPKTYLCKGPGLAIDAGGAAGVRVETFDGPHPAGLVGTHIHLLEPVSRERIVWHIGYQDVVAVGRLFATGELDFTRIVALGGPVAKRPRLLSTRAGASLDELTAGELQAGENRVVSGSVFGGRKAVGEVDGYLGRYVNQVSVLAEGRQRELLGWLAPGARKYSTIPVYFGYLAKLFGKKFDFTTTTNGSPRAMVPIGMYERVMPLDILPTFLLRSLLVGDTDRAVALGALELDEEDLALCTFVDPGKSDFGAVLRQNLNEIEKEG
ncbi:Na+-transporting NADH:ubiquinone oxidoreductase subunit A [Nannocystis exedens]|uniref:Na(+)-translocating NADH-quinone reductase subunit A n=1 Tax=Nannocystis exedens TaxID=54 RepID=A0A1I1SRN6_9BACT|nr:Na(+)-translocating NADH-quinone reductase subunit A [Nannocystis exedens]PCC75489.1 NADH:ubiquinone reductase (Na(+)-transporting) subunit A [Nannocystis exedens]SFD45740.1 Na+-transporting NADH:ubiquinone oxidoreductase subunit A [Nannocystis exedens]